MLGTVAALLVLLLVAVGARVAVLWNRVDHQLGRVDALSAAADTSDGETWLIAGSDSRSGTSMEGDGVEGARTDSIMVLSKAPNGQVSLVSLPRDTYVDIPGYGGDKINSAYTRGGAPLLVTTVEDLTG